MKTQISASLLVLVLTVLSGIAHAAIPGLGTPSFADPKLGAYRSQLGFEISAGTSGWQQTEAPKDKKFIATLYKAPNSKDGENATLTVRVDPVKKDLSLDKYVERWMKEYPKYGFDVLGSKPFSQGKQRGFVLDLINRDNGKQMRQVVFMKNQNAVIMTCRDQKQNFATTLKNCNQIIRTFNWN